MCMCVGVYVLTLTDALHELTHVGNDSRNFKGVAIHTDETHVSRGINGSSTVMKEGEGM